MRPDPDFQELTLDCIRLPIRRSHQDGPQVADVSERESGWMRRCINRAAEIHRESTERWTQTQANLGPMSIVSDSRTNSTTAGRLQRPQASFVRNVYEVRAKMKDLRLSGQPSKRRVGF